MSLPPDRVPDLSLEPLGDRNRARRDHLVEAAQVRILEQAPTSAGRFSAAYQALIDAIFTAPSATEWLHGMWKKVTALLAERDAARTPAPPASDAIRAADSDPKRT